MRLPVDHLKQQWAGKKAVLLGLAIGLLAGPLISGLMGWQVTSAFLTQSVRQAIVAQQVEFCQFRARAAVKDTDKMEYSTRYAVAEKWAKLPGQAAADSDVVAGCTYGLAG